MLPATVREAQSAAKDITKEDVLRLIIKNEIKPIIRRISLKREVVVGWIGFRGDGKSGSGSSVMFVDCLVDGIPVYSNMPIKCDMEVGRESAQKYGLNAGGVVHYETRPLDNYELVRFDTKFFGCGIFGDEINMELSNVRKAMTNTNVLTNDVWQQIRKWETPLFCYTVIDEMFIDNQLRSLTDIFIKCEDTALSVDGLSAHKALGKDIKWVIYPMSAYLAGRENSYKVTQRSMPPVYFHLDRLLGIYDHKKMQAAGKVKYGIDFKRKDESKSFAAEMEVDTGKQDKEYNRWQWFFDRMPAIYKQLKAEGVKVVDKAKVYSMLGEEAANPASIVYIGMQLTGAGFQTVKKNKWKLPEERESLA